MTVQLADWNQRYAHRVIVDNMGCHVWQGSMTSAGYGDVGFQKRHYLIHRVAYEVFVGPIPEGLCIDHLCRNRACVNPDHLEVVTWGENIRRGDAPRVASERLKRRAAETTECKRGHPLSGDNVYRSPKTGYRACLTCRALRKKGLL